MNTPVNPSFTLLNWGVRGYKSHGHVFMMPCERGVFKSYYLPISEKSEKHVHILPNFIIYCVTISLFYKHFEYDMYIT